MSNPLLGVFFHWLGGFASASFYVPFRNVKSWAWEIYWLVGGIFSWILAPWFFAYLQTPELFKVLAQSDAQTLGLCMFFGLLWGLGGLTFGLTMRYLGLSLGMAVALGLCAFFGTLIPPMVKGSFFTEVLPSLHGKIILGGLALCLLGIAIIGLGGRYKERELDAAEAKAQIAEFDLRKGIAVAIFCGLMSSCFAFGISAGDSIAQTARDLGANPLFAGLPVICVVLVGGATTNFIWCAFLISRNQSWQSVKNLNQNAGACHWKNLFWCGLAGVTWYFQFFFYTMGESQMGKYGFSSWTLHMASIIIFSSLWGLALKEWQGASRKTLATVFAGLFCLVASTVVIGVGNSLKI